jgi:SAM-dependent methyltransferase
MSPYHKYVFQEEKKVYLGKFEEMYKNEDMEGFDSWFQDTLTELDKRITLSLLDQYNFSNILDVGCGKGTFTHLLKKKNNRVVAIDMSDTAIRKGNAKYLDIEFKVLKAEKVRELDQKFDLIVLMETLSYIKNWKKLLSDISMMTTYFYLTLFIPDNPIGFVKSFDDLSEVIQRHFKIIHKLVDESAKRIFCFGQTLR